MTDLPPTSDLRELTPEDATRGFELGPIRPPSEAHSLLVRVIRNCTWNRCTFCPVYKGTRSSQRELEDVLADVDAMAGLPGNVTAGRRSAVSSASPSRS